MSVPSRGADATRHSPSSDDLERYITEATEADHRFRAAIEDAEDLQRLLDCLTTLRHDREISQTEVARRMGVRQPTVSEFEKASSDPKFSTLQRYARAIDAQLRTIVEASGTCEWASPSTLAYARGVSTPRAIRAQKDRGLVPAWTASHHARSGAAAIA